MSTSTKELSPIQILFKRPAVAVGFLLIIVMIAVKPAYNTISVLLAIPLYWILYQCRRYIYRLGIGRFDFLALLLYSSIVLSGFCAWEYHDNGVWEQLRGIRIGSLFVDSGYFSQIKDFIITNLDNLVHWKMIVFTPAVAAILYLVFVEFDRKMVKEADLQSLGLTDNDLYQRGDVFSILGGLTFIFASCLFGAQYGGGALVIVSIMSYLKPKLLAIFTLIVSTAILVFNYADFEYISLLSVPTQLMHGMINQGLWTSIKSVSNWGMHNNIGQLYVLVPYMLMMGLVAWQSIWNRAKVAYVQEDSAMAHKIATTVDAIDFGHEIAGRKPVRIMHKELNTHMYINGASGSGKTVAMLNFVIEAAEKKLPLIYIDGKGSTDLEEKISKIAKNYGRKFKIFTLSPGAVPETSPYDFLGSGTFTEKKNRVMQLFIQADAAGVSYYQDNLETFINRVFMIIHQNKLKIDLFRFLTLISNINDLVELADQPIMLEDGSKVHLKEYFEDIRDMKPEQSPRTRIITKLDPFIHSSYGHLFNVIDKPNVINLKESIKNGEIVLFLFDASAYALDTERVAKMVISDINATFAEFGKEKNPIKTFCCFDEFKSYETDAISKTISLHRSNGMHAIIGTQSLALIDKDIGNGILSNCQTHLVMCSADADAERFAEEFGKLDRMEVTTRIKADVQEVSDLSTKRVRDYKVDKQDIKDIKVNTGQGYLHRKVTGAKPVKIQVTYKA